MFAQVGESNGCILPCLCQSVINYLHSEESWLAECVVCETCRCRQPVGWQSWPAKARSAIARRCSKVVDLQMLVSESTSVYICHSLLFSLKRRNKLKFSVAFDSVAWVRGTFYARTNLQVMRWTPPHKSVVVTLVSFRDDFFKRAFGNDLVIIFWTKRWMHIVPKFCTTSASLL